MINPKFKLKVNRNFRGGLEPHEVFLDRLAQQQEDELPESEKKVERPLPEKKLWFLLFGVLLVFGSLVGRSFWLQIVEGREYSAKSLSNQFIVRSIRSERGVIYDRFMNQLVRNQKVYRLMIEPEKAFQGSADKSQLLRRLSDFTGLSLDELNDRLEQDKKEIVLQEELDYDQVILWETKSEDWPGVYLDQQLLRHYVDEGGLSHVLGYVSKADRVGASGLEKYYNDSLSDRAGSYQFERDARGRILSEEIIQDPEPGDSLVLNLDWDLQIMMEEALRAKMEEVGSREANAVALDPRDGSVRAIISIPGYDNNIFSRSLTSQEIDEIISGPDFSLFNQAISGIGYSTGSVIKPLIATAALEEGVIDPDKKIYAPREICLPHLYTGESQCFRDWRFHGMTDMRRSLAESVNTYFYMIGGGYEDQRGLGASKIKEWLESFGWDDQTGIDLPNEGRGRLPNIDHNWRLGSTYHFSIGQGDFSVTPLQVASAYAALANGGILYQPQLVHQIIRQNGNERETVETFEPRIVNPSVASYDSIRVVREGMRQAVTSPQSPTHSLNNLPVTAAIKTGTAQTGRDQVYHNWIALFAPYEEPEVVMVFMIRDVYESMIAVRSVAQDVLGLYFSDKGDKFSQDKDL